MTTITRDELRAAIEAGIKKTAEQFPQSFTIDEATKLRVVADTATYVASGVYSAEDPRGTGGSVGCPVAQAFEDWRTLTWDRSFTDAFDRAVMAAVPGGGWEGLQVVEATS